MFKFLDHGYCKQYAGVVAGRSEELLLNGAISPNLGMGYNGSKHSDTDGVVLWSRLRDYTCSNIAYVVLSER